MSTGPSLKYGTRWKSRASGGAVIARTQAGPALHGCDGWVVPAEQPCYSCSLAGASLRQLTQLVPYEAEGLGQWPRGGIQTGIPMMSPSCSRTDDGWFTASGLLVRMDGLTC